MSATIEGAREALNHSLDTLEDGELRAAAAWAAIAADTLEACQLTPEEQRELIAPRDDVPTSEKISFVLFVLTIAAILGLVVNGWPK